MPSECLGSSTEPISSFLGIGGAVIPAERHGTPAAPRRLWSSVRRQHSRHRSGPSREGSVMDRSELARFLRSRREALQPEDVGLPRTRRRRTGGLRREEVAALSNMSTDYYCRIEQQRGPRPSEQMLGAIAQGLRLTAEEHDHLLRLAGHPVPVRVSRTDHVNPGMLRIFDRLEDTPAHIVSHLGETLVQNQLSRLLLGDQTRHTGPARSLAYRWFTDSAERRLIPAENHAHHGTTITAQLLAAHTRDPHDPRMTTLVRTLLNTSTEFAALWSERLLRTQTPGTSPGRLSGTTRTEPDRPRPLTDPHRLHRRPHQRQRWQTPTPLRSRRTVGLSSR